MIATVDPPLRSNSLLLDPPSRLRQDGQEVVKPSSWGPLGEPNSEGKQQTSLLQDKNQPEATTKLQDNNQNCKTCKTCYLLKKYASQPSGP